MNHLEISAGLSGKLEQRTILSQTQRRSLEMLAMPVAALDEFLNAELMVNPMLEMADEFPLGSPDPESETSLSGDEDENDYERNSILAEEWSDSLPIPGDGGEERDFFSNLPAPPPELKSSLKAELDAMTLPEDLYRAALEIIGSLNDDGYLAGTLADLAMVAMVDMADMEAALTLVQQISPAGVGARDLPECLKLQLERSGKLTPLLERLLNEGIADLEKNRLDLLAQKLQISQKELEDLLGTLRKLNPAPGRDSRVSGEVIIPDLVIEKDADGEYRVIPRSTPVMRLTISERYEKLLQNTGLSAGDRAFLSEKLASARDLLHSLERRGSTLVRIGKLLIKYQRDFLENGTSALKSMTMKDAAAELEVSESTVSRAVDQKFVHTPQGVFPLRFFFSAGYSTDEGGDISGQAVKAKIRQLIDDEDPAHPLSDDAIAGILKDQGVPVARRTVAKYRDALNIPASSLRKKFF